MEKMGGRGDPPFSGYGYGPSVACAVGCAWLMYSLFMAHIWPMYDLYMALRSDVASLVHLLVRRFLSMLMLEIDAT